ncbi:hypothetical protein AVEN_213272-1 [Araneus ventricosus]|uniref:Tc1-like transposase DDE domain-containing protein n=1 Tax=Araneus ventricosus TaxID=182803 RepID=A0A4Y2DFB4_ARAVE|nr:hypothetical protein AVEN_213272-1 [Araneus ventricosus]
MSQTPEETNSATSGPVNIAVGHQISGVTYSLRMSFYLTSRNAMIWQEQGTRYRALNIVERDHYRGGGLLVWAGIAMNGRTYLNVFAGGSDTVLRYLDEILHPLERPFIAALGTDAIFMDDNTHPHRTRLVRSYLKSETIPQMAWPDRSPALNPIEHVWDKLGRRITGRVCHQAPS